MAVPAAVPVGAASAPVVAEVAVPVGAASAPVGAALAPVEALAAVPVGAALAPVAAEGAGAVSAQAVVEMATDSVTVKDSDSVMGLATVPVMEAEAVEKQPRTSLPEPEQLSWWWQSLS